MRLRYKSRPLITLLIGLVLILGSCTKFTKVELASEGSIYMVQAQGTRSTLTAYWIDSTQTYVFGAAYGGLKTAPTDINVTFVVDTNAVAAYNAVNGTAYVVLPSAAYSLPTLTTSIKTGQTSSDPLTFVLTAKKLMEQGTKYMLPIKMTSISSGKFDSSLSISYFMVDSLYIREKNIDNLGTLSVSQENSGGPGVTEGSNSVVDDDNSTKFYAGDFNAPGLWLQLTFDSVETVNAYSITSGNDSPDRDPKDWKLQASNDGSVWVDLDTQTGQMFPGRNQEVTYKMTNNSPYKYYRLNVTANNGAGDFQMSEWRLFQYY